MLLKIERLISNQMIWRMNRAIRFTPNFKRKNSGCSLLSLAHRFGLYIHPFLNVYKYLTNGYLKINRVIAFGKGTLGISLKIRNPKSKWKIEIIVAFFERDCWKFTWISIVQSIQFSKLKPGRKISFSSVFKRI